jgi:hypothetical protein
MRAYRISLRFYNEAARVARTLLSAKGFTTTPAWDSRAKGGDFSAIHIFAMSQGEHQDSNLLILDIADQSIVTHPVVAQFGDGQIEP